MIAVVEIPKGSRYKYEINKENGRLLLDRVINQDIPFNYGYIPNTMCEDGDQLDVFILGNQSIPPLTEVKIEPLALLKCRDKGLRDDKLIARIVGDEQKKFFHELTLIIDYLSTYKEGFEILDYEEGFNLNDYSTGR